MSRIRANVVIDGHNFWTLFDTGARNTYVVRDVASLSPTIELDRPEPVALGGRVYQVRRECHLTCLVEGLPVRTRARVLEEIGTDDEGKRVEILIGALTMQEWGIRPIPDEERLDMTHYPKEFIEFWEPCINRLRRVRKAFPCCQGAPGTGRGRPSVADGMPFHELCKGLTLGNV